MVPMLLIIEIYVGENPPKDADWAADIAGFFFFFLRGKENKEPNKGKIWLSLGAHLFIMFHDRRI